MSQGMIARGHRAKIITVGGSPMPPGADWVDPCGVPVKMFGESWPARYRDYIFALGVGWTLWKERKNYQVAYFLMQGIHLLTGLLVARLLGKAIVMKFSCSSLVALMTSSMTGRLSLYFLREWADRILILNPGMVEECRQVDFDLNKVSWMPNPVDTNEFKPCTPAEKIEIRNRLGLPAEAPIIVFVGRLDHQKKIPWMLGAFKKVVAERPDTILAMVGDGPLREQIHALVDELGLKRNVVFTGRLPMSGVLEWLKLSDLTTLVSEVEGLPCSLIEAMAAGLPPVVSTIPAHTQLINHEEHGLLTELGNEESIAAGLLRLVNDEPLRLRLGQKARERMIAEFSTPQVVVCYEKLFNEVLGSPNN
jgi:glycosyltransferase involved in cell wall biosynthesis